MALEGAATVLQAVAEVTKTGSWNAGEPQAECAEAKREDGHEREQETRLPNGNSVACPYGSKNKGETQVRCPEEEKTEGGHEKERETRLPNGSTAGCPYARPSAIIPYLRELDSPSPRLAELLEGAVLPGDCGNPPEPPEWLDRELFNEGRRFYKNYLVCVMFSGLLSLAMDLVEDYARKPLIYTGRSDSPVKARRRYMSTLFHLMAWYEGDVWDPSSPAHRDIMAIRTTHRKLGRTFNQSGEYEKVSSVSVEARGYHQPPDSLLPALKEDLRAAGVKEHTRKEEKDQVEEYPVGISHGKEERTMEMEKKVELEEDKEQMRQEFPTFKAKEDVKDEKNKKMQNQDSNTQKEEKKKEEEEEEEEEEEGEEEEEENARRTSLAVTKEEEKKNKEYKGKEIRKSQDLTTQKEEKKAADNAQKISPVTSKDQERRTKTEDQEEHRAFISQLDMSFTQCAFMGMLVAHPTKLGAGAATKREMEGLVHFWRGLGWLLGIEDRYNFCAGTVEDTISLYLEIERDILLPLLLEANWDYEHMASCVVNGVGQFLPFMSYPAMIRYLAHTLDLPAPALSRSLTWREWYQYWMLRLNFGLIYYMPGFLQKLNKGYLGLLEKVKEEDKVNFAAYRKAQAALTVPEQDVK